MTVEIFIGMIQRLDLPLSLVYLLGTFFDIFFQFASACLQVSDAQAVTQKSDTHYQ
jgi:hypothetical protein